MHDGIPHMTRRLLRSLGLTMLMTSCLLAQDIDPFPKPITQNGEPIRVNVAEFASIPDAGGEAARMMLLVNEPGTRRLFVNDMRGPLYGVSYDGKTVVKYVDINAPNWGVSVQSQGRERGFQSFAFHPQFGQPGMRGYGKFYTYTDSSNMQPKPDFVPAGGMNTHDTVLLEWTAKNAAAPSYDGVPPRDGRHRTRAAAAPPVRVHDRAPCASLRARRAGSPSPRAQRRVRPARPRPPGRDGGRG